MSVIDNLSPEQLEALKAKAKEKLQQRAKQSNQQPSQTPPPKDDVLTKGLIRLDIKKRVQKAKSKSSLGIYRAGKEKQAIKTEIIEKLQMYIKKMQ